MLKDNFIKNMNSLRAQLDNIKEQNTMSLPVVLLLFPTLTVLLAVIGFYFGVSLTKWHGCVSFVICLVLGLFCASSLKRGSKVIGIFFGVVVVGFLWSSLLFMTAGTDGMAYHIPGAILLSQGWNPVLDSTSTALRASMNLDLRIIRISPLLHFGKIAQIWGGVAYLLSGNMSATMTSSFFLMVCMGIYIHKFHKSLLGDSVVWRWVLIIALISCTKITGMLAGLVDYIVYTSIVLIVLSAILYYKEQQTKDLLVFCLSIIWLTNAKVSGILFCMVILVLLFMSMLYLFFVKGYSLVPLKKWTGAVIATGLVALICGSSPYITNWINYGGPAYPEHSFNKNVERDSLLTSVYKSDADGDKVGYCGRVVYAWFSKRTVVEYYKRKAGNEGFSPKFHTEWDLNGYGTVFGLLMSVSVLLFAASKRSFVDIAIGVLFISAIAMPINYIGNSRYSPQMWAVPFLVIMNFMVRPCALVERLCAKTQLPVFQVVKLGCYSLIILVVFASTVRFGFYNLYLLDGSAKRLESLEKLKQRGSVNILMSDTRTQSFACFTNEIKLTHSAESFFQEQNIKDFGLDKCNFVYSGQVSIKERIAPNQCVMFVDKGFLLTDGSIEEYERWFGANSGKIVNSFADIKNYPLKNSVKLMLRYLKQITFLRYRQFMTAWGWPVRV